MIIVEVLGNSLPRHLKINYLHTNPSPCTCSIGKRRKFIQFRSAYVRFMKCDACNEKVSKKGKKDKCNVHRTECDKVPYCTRWT